MAIKLALVQKFKFERFVHKFEKLWQDWNIYQKIDKIFNLYFDSLYGEFMICELLVRLILRDFVIKR